MVGKTVVVTLPDGRTVPGLEVLVENSNEKWSEFTLADGTTLRIKVNVITVTRALGEYDQTGSPVYQVTAAPTIVFTDVPDNLKRPPVS